MKGGRKGEGEGGRNGKKVEWKQMLVCKGMCVYVSPWKDSSSERERCVCVCMYGVGGWHSMPECAEEAREESHLWTRWSLRGMAGAQ
jgi:hypothetical protein